MPIGACPDASRSPLRSPLDFCPAPKRGRSKKKPVSFYFLALCLACLNARPLLRSNGRANPAPQGTVAGQEISGVVTIVFDGDTIQVRLNDGSRENVRMIGVDSPEMDESREDIQFWAHMAKRFAFHHLYRKSVSLSFDWEPRDKYGRLLAYVRTADGILFNEFIIREGFAAALLAFPYEKKYQTLFKSAEREAKQWGRGMWRKGDPPLVSAIDAFRSSGQVLTVRFICESVQLRGDFAHLKSRATDFEALIPRAKLSGFPEWKSFPGRELFVTGLLEIFRETPQIIVFSAKQLGEEKFRSSPIF